MNEIAIFEKGSTDPLRGLKVSEKSIDVKDKGFVENLFDEQNKVDYNHSFMSGMIFDEIYHARAAYEYLHHIEPYEWTHPPLGKVFISIGIALFGMNPFGWRIIGTLFGVAMIPVMYLFGRKMFTKKFYAFCSAFLMMFDFMHFGLTRIATVDVYATFFVILMYYFLMDYYVKKSTHLGYKKSLVLLFFTGVAFGLGTSAKWVGLYAGGGLALLFFMTKYYEFKDYLWCEKSRKSLKIPWFKDFYSKHIGATFLYCILFFIIIPVSMYAISYIPFMLVPGSGSAVEVIYRNQINMFQYHSQTVIGATHSFSSHWWQWPIMQRPLETYWRGDLPSGISSSMVIMGNPAVWWAGIAAVWMISIMAFMKQKRKIMSILGVFLSVIFIAVGSGILQNLGIFALAIMILMWVIKYDKKLTVIFIALAFQYLPWVPIERITFIYHFFSSVPFIIFSIVYIIKVFMEKYPKAKYFIGTYLVIVALLFAMFYPVLSGIETSREYVEHFLLWFKGSWVF